MPDVTLDPLAENPTGPLAPGTNAPGFDLPCTADQKVCLSDFAGKPLIMAVLSRRLESGVRRSNGVV